jgi:hypothetical protein
MFRHKLLLVSVTVGRLVVCLKKKIVWQNFHLKICCSSTLQLTISATGPNLMLCAIHTVYCGCQSHCYSRYYQCMYYSSQITFITCIRRAPDYSIYWVPYYVYNMGATKTVYIGCHTTYISVAALRAYVGRQITCIIWVPQKLYMSGATQRICR